MSEYHEPEDELGPDVRDFHRALTSLKEELEAVDWYNQRWQACKEESLRAILAHNRDEEIEHACMALEWLRRTMPHWDAMLRTYLFAEGPITEIEKASTSAEAKVAPVATSPAAGDLGIGSLRRLL